MSTVLTIYYDGFCSVCSAQMKKLRELDKGDNFSYVDIRAKDFDAAKENLNPLQVRQKIHVRRADGKLFVGVDGLLEVAQHLPQFRVFASLGKLTPLKPFMHAGYYIFARWIRPLVSKPATDACDLHRFPPDQG